MENPNPYLAPVGEAALAVDPDMMREGLVIDSEFAGTPRARLAAIVIDWLLLIPLSFIAGVAASILMAFQSRTPDEVAIALSSANMLDGLVLFVLYRTLCEWIAGGTVGKLVLGLRVRRAADFGPCGPFAALVRTLLFFVDSFFFGLPALWSMRQSPMNARIGDNVGGTVVVRQAGIPQHARLSTARTVLGVALALCTQILLHTALLAL